MSLIVGVSCISGNSLWPARRSWFAGLRTRSPAGGERTAAHDCRAGEGAAERRTANASAEASTWATLSVRFTALCHCRDQLFSISAKAFQSPEAFFSFVKAVCFPALLQKQRVCARGAVEPGRVAKTERHTATLPVVYSQITLRFSSRLPGCIFLVSEEICHCVQVTSVTSSSLASAIGLTFI